MSIVITHKVDILISEGTTPDELIFQVNDPDHEYFIHFDKKGVFDSDAASLDGMKPVKFTRLRRGSDDQTDYRIEVRSIHPVPPLG